MRAGLVALVLLLIPTSLMAATVEASRTLVASEPSDGNAYYVGGDVSSAAPVPGDLTAIGGNVVVSAPVAADALIAGGTIDVRKAVGGDLRALGARIMVDDSVAGDLVLFGGSVLVEATPAFAWIGGGNVSLLSGANGPVTIYGSTVTLSGTFAGNVDVVASDRLSLAPGTSIKGYLHYNAPQEADIPDGTEVDGGVAYTGKSFLPTTQEAQTFAIAGASVFFLVRIIAALIAAGLFAGLFPSFAQTVADDNLARSFKHFALLALLGFAALVATPVLIVLLLVTFAGAGLAFILLAAYVLLILLSYVYAAIIAGSALARQIVKRDTVLWRDGIFGMLALSLISLVPVLGSLVLIVLIASACGTLVSLFYHFAFDHGDPLDV